MITGTFINTVKTHTHMQAHAHIHIQAHRECLIKCIVALLILLKDIFSVIYDAGVLQMMQTRIQSLLSAMDR